MFHLDTTSGSTLTELELPLNLTSLRSNADYFMLFFRESPMANEVDPTAVTNGIAVSGSTDRDYGLGELTSSQSCQGHHAHTAQMST